MFSQADAYERFMGRWSRRLAPLLVSFAEVRDGDAVLDVGSGTGSLSFAVRDATKTSRVTGVDLSREYVAGASAKNTDPRVRFEVGSAEDLPLPDASFDKALSMLVLNFVPDRARAVREMSRVTKPGGSVVAAIWDYGGGMQMLRTFWDEAVAFDPSIAARDEAHMHLCREAELGALWREAGFEDVREAPLDLEMSFTSFDDYWAPFLLGQGPAGAYLASLPKDRQSELGERIRKRLLGAAPDGPISMRGRAWAAKGTVAPRIR